MSKEFDESLLVRLLSLSTKGHVKIDFDRKRRVFCFSAPIYRSGKQIPHSILSYVKERKDKSFRPHNTSFTIDENLDVRLIQEVPFQRDVQRTTRQLMLEFLQLAQKCHEMLREMGIEEKIADLQNLSSETDS